MKKQIKEIPSILFLMISFGVAIRVMTGGKEEVPLHWNVRGEIDSWGDTWTIVLLPVIALALYGLLTLLQQTHVGYDRSYQEPRYAALSLYYAVCGANHRAEYLCVATYRSCHTVHNYCYVQKIRTVFLKPIADDCCFFLIRLSCVSVFFTWPNYATSM